MKICLPYDRLLDKGNRQFSKALRARYDAALAVGVVGAPDLGDDDILRVALHKPHRIKPADIVAIVKAGGEVEGSEIYAQVDPATACLLSGEPETWAEWLAQQAPNIVPSDPADGFLYFGCRDAGGAWSGRKLKLLHDAGVTLLTRKEFMEANPSPANP